MKIQIKRVYDGVNKGDGFRVLVDRLWPRGMTKRAARIDVWLKEVAPSNELRMWFHKDKEARFNDFEKRYKKELVAGEGLPQLRKLLRGKKMVTIVTGVKDVKGSHIPALMKALKKPN